MVTDTPESFSAKVFMPSTMMGINQQPRWLFFLMKKLGLSCRVLTITVALYIPVKPHTSTSVCPKVGTGFATNSFESGCISHMQA